MHSFNFERENADRFNRATPPYQGALSLFHSLHVSIVHLLTLFGLSPNRYWSPQGIAQTDTAVALKPKSHCQPKDLMVVVGQFTLGRNLAADSY